MIGLRIMLHGLTTDIWCQLKAPCCLHDTDIAKLIEKARSLVAVSETNPVAVSKSSVERYKDNKWDCRKCFTSEVEGVLACSFNEQKTVSYVICYWCGEIGYYASKCQTKLFRLIQ